MRDYITEIMLSVGSMSDRSTFELILNQIFTLPIVTDDSKIKRGPILWVKTARNTFVQFITWEKAKSYNENIEIVKLKLSKLVDHLPYVIVEQVIYPESFSIDFHEEEIQE